MKHTQQKFVLASLAMTLVISSQSVIAKVSPDNPLLNQNREAVSFSWKVQDNYVPNPVDVISSTQESVEYWKIVSGADLSKGISIRTSAPGALVRINEISSNTRSSTQSKISADAAVQPLALEVKAPNGKTFSHGNAMSLNVSAKAMKDAGSPFPNGTSGFQLKASLGHGAFTISNTTALKASAQYSVHVFDKQSTQRLSVTRNQANYSKGDILTLEGDFTDSRTGKYQRIAINDISGFVRTPHGNTLPLKMNRGVLGQFKATLPLNMEPEFGGLYEAYIDTNANGLQRRVKTAFALVKPTADLKQSFAGNLQQGLALNVDVKEAGRYEVRGVLYGTNRSGELQALLNTSTAQWLGQGQASLNLEFDQKLVVASGLKAPFKLRYLQLLDQSRMGNLSLSQESISIFGDALPQPRHPLIEIDRFIDSKDIAQSLLQRQQQVAPISSTPNQNKKDLVKDNLDTIGDFR